MGPAGNPVDFDFYTDCAPILDQKLQWPTPDFNFHLQWATGLLNTPNYNITSLPEIVEQLMTIGNEAMSIDYMASTDDVIMPPVENRSENKMSIEYAPNMKKH